MHNEELHVLYYSPNINWVMTSIGRRLEGNVARGAYGERRETYRVLVEKPEGKRPIGRTGHKWEPNKIVLQKMGLACTLD